VQNLESWSVENFALMFLVGYGVHLYCDLRICEQTFGPLKCRGIEALRMIKYTLSVVLQYPQNTDALPLSILAHKTHIPRP
jgi:hypothetical protein